MFFDFLFYTIIIAILAGAVGLLIGFFLVKKDRKSAYEELFGKKDCK